MGNVINIERDHGRDRIRIKHFYPSSAADRLLSRLVIALPKNVTPQGPAAAETLEAV